MDYYFRRNDEHDQSIILPMLTCASMVLDGFSTINNF
jgi:hypothetical protein